MKYILAIILFFFWIPAEAHAGFIGYKSAYRLCHVQITLGHTDYAEADIGHIWINRKKLGRLNHQIQRFIIKHECAHARGITSEVGADRYALRHLKTSRWVRNEMCRELRAYGDIHFRVRCRQLRGR